MLPTSPIRRPWTPKDALVERTEPRGLAGVVWRYFARTAWVGDAAKREGVRGAWWRCVRVAYLATSGFLRDRCLFRAAALTYVTVLSIVPLLALTFAVAKGFGFYADLRHDTIDPFLDTTFGPSEVVAGEATSEKAHAARTALKEVLDLVDKTDVKVLGWMGLAFVLATAIKLLSSIEQSFNEIWGVQRARRWIRKLTDYLAMLVVAPLVVFIAAGATAAARASSLYASIEQHAQLGWLVSGLLRLSPLIALWLGFMFVYLALPNARTRFSSAMLGAFVGGTLWQGMLLAHLEFQIGIARYNPIYSSFAALPVFLIWINASWIAVLLGAEVCNAHQSEPACQFPAETTAESQSARERLALRAVGRIGAAFISGGAPWTLERLAQDLSTTTRTLSEILPVLVRAGILVESADGAERPYLPARDLDQIRIKSVLDALRGVTLEESANALAAAGAAGGSAGNVDQRIARLLAEIDEDFATSRHNGTLRALAEASLKARGAASEREAPGAAVAPSAG